VCVRDESAGQAIVADDCPGAGAARILVTTETRTCDDLSAALTSVAPGVTVSSQFADAPPAIRDHYCVFEDASDGVSAVPQLLSALCSNDSVSLVVHDCSTGDFVAGEGQVVRPSHVPQRGEGAPAFTDPLTDPTDAGSNIGPHSCDTCGTVNEDVLYVNLPASMMATAPATMVLRFLSGSLPDRAVLPPVGAQSFSVPKLGAPNGAPVRLYAPGEVPPAP
jgi:hypothetical protein